MGVNKRELQTMKKIIVLLIFLPLSGFAFGQYSVTNTFVTSTPARASEVNQNFQDLVDACNDLRTDLDAILSSQWVDGTAGAIYYDGGNVGIGTTGPSAILHVQGG